MIGEVSIYKSASAEQTEEFGRSFGEQLPVNSVVTLHGDLGAGKTTLVRGLAAGILKVKGASQEVSSPTFSLLNIYSGTPTLYHFDLYRLPHSNEFLAAGFDEFFHANGICCIEWAEKIEPLIPKQSIRITLRYLGEGERELTIEKRG